MFLIAWAMLALLGLIAGAFLIHGHFLIVTVEHQSMLPTFQHGDRVLALRRGFQRWIRRGSIVLVVLPDSAVLPEPPDIYIKRVVASGGETITLPVPQQEWARESVEQPTMEEQTWSVPLRHVFVCGDNRASSVDSRQWGPIPLSDIRGLILFKLRPAPVSSMPRRTPVPFFQPNKLQPGELAPLFSIVSQQGETIALESYRGQRVLLLFTSAGPLMRQRLPPYLSFARHLEALGIRTLLACSAPEDQTQSLIEELGISFPVLAVPKEQHPLFEEYGVSFTPAYCLIGTDGRVLTSGLALMGTSSWQEDILSYLSRCQSEAI